MNMKNAAGHTDRHHPGITGGRCRHLPGGGRCRSRQQSRLERARTASQAWSQRENDVALPAVLPVPHQGHQYHSSAVPQPGEVLRDLENQVCDAVVDRVNDHLPGNIDPWKDYNL